MRNIFLISANIILCIFLFCIKITGGGLHAAAGMMLFLVNTVHCCIQYRKMKHQKISVKVTDIILTLALIVMLASGIMMHPSGNILIIKILHKISSLLFVIGIIIHVISHRKRMRIAVL